MESRKTIHDILLIIGADRVPHSGSSLISHLLGTYDILKSWNCSETICTAGGLHSIYGTNIYLPESISINARIPIQNFFGEDTEHLIWLFGSINRPLAIETGFGYDWRKSVSIILPPIELNALRLIEAANLLEQGAELTRWTNINEAMKHQCNYQTSI